MLDAMDEVLQRLYAAKLCDDESMKGMVMVATAEKKVLKAAFQWVPPEGATVEELGGADHE